MKNLKCWLVILGLAACDQPEPRVCDETTWASDDDCKSAYVVEGRESDTVLLDEGRVSATFAEIVAAKALDCDLTATAAIPHTGYVDSVYVWEVSNETVAENWSTGEIATGVDEVDFLFVANGATSVTTSGSGYIIEFSWPFSTYALAELAQPFGITIQTDEAVAPGTDIVRNAPDSYRLTLGWGDCLPGCMNVHFWDVHLQDGVATPMEEGGDPLPTEIHQASCG